MDGTRNQLINGEVLKIGTAVRILWCRTFFAMSDTVPNPSLPVLRLAEDFSLPTQITRNQLPMVEGLTQICGAYAIPGGGLPSMGGGPSINLSVLVLGSFCVTNLADPYFASGHTALNTPDPIRTRKLSSARPGQYWGGGPPGKPLGCCWLFGVYAAS